MSCFKFISIFVFNVLVFSGCTESESRKSGFNNLRHFCDVKYEDTDMKQYSYTHLPSRLALVLFDNEYQDGDCSILKQGSEVLQKIHEMFRFITDENYSLYSCKKESVLNIYALPDYVLGEYDSRTSESSDLCLFKEYPMGRKSYNLIYNVDYHTDKFEFQKLIVFGG